MDKHRQKLQEASAKVIQAMRDSAEPCGISLEECKADCRKAHILLQARDAEILLLKEQLEQKQKENRR